MKRIALLVLLFAAVAASAHAVGPIPNVPYTCNYYNYSGLAVNGGDSVFDIPAVGSLRRGIEYFDAFHPRFGYFTENQKVTFASPVHISGGTRWEFTVNPSGPQCAVDVLNFGNLLVFFNCTDGHSRICVR